MPAWSRSGAGGGIAVFVTLEPAELIAQGRRCEPDDLNAYLRIGADGRVAVYTERGSIAASLGLAEEKVRAITPRAGGGLGGRSGRRERAGAGR